MFKKMKHIKNEKGLTLIELLAVIVILAIIAAIAIPAIGNIINNSRDKAILSDVQNAVSAAKIALADGSCGDVDANGKVECALDEFEFESGKLSDITITFNGSKAETIVATLVKGFYGEKIPALVDADKGDTELTTDEDEIIAALGGN